jgi:hypothetical protein
MTKHCRLEQVSSRDWSRKSCHDYPVTDIHRLLPIERGALRSRLTWELTWEETGDNEFNRQARVHCPPHIGAVLTSPGALAQEALKVWKVSILWHAANLQEEMVMFQARKAAASGWLALSVGAKNATTA